MDSSLAPRRVALPVALLAAIAIAAGGGSSPWAAPEPLRHGRPEAAPALGVPSVKLEQIELVAVRAPSTLPGSGVVGAGVAAAVTTLDLPPAPAAAPAGPKPASSASERYTGTNHFWFPSLGISRTVHSYPCSRTREPANFVYRWGCAGRNNVYLLGHAWGVFKPLNVAYKRGRLHVGMRAYYTDGAGRLSVYEVTEWRVVNPVNSRWAIAGQSVPSMTLQTCVGDLRLNVRLVRVRI
ncbi:MAG TPA: hypothetical protein VFI15_12140 [Candidatus Limnocylindrales bacterium]|nr:hypothetical protein [Candidatus Limnocylindrales bacterium]